MTIIYFGLWFLACGLYIAFLNWVNLSVEDRVTKVLRFEFACDQLWQWFREAL